MSTVLERLVPGAAAVLAASIAWFAASTFAGGGPGSPARPAPSAAATAPSPPPPPSAPADPGGSPTPPVPVAPAGDTPIGLCNGIGSVPLRHQRGFDFARYAELLAEDIARARSAGVRWYRHNTVAYPYFDQHSLEESGWDFGHRDLLVKAVQDAGMDLLLVLGPTRGNANCEHEPAVWQGESYLPRTEEGRAAYRDYVRRMVERYDGDGRDDMPGLVRKVIWYELDNEVDLHHQRCRSLGRDWQSPEEFFQMLRLTREASKEADPGSKLVPGFAAMGGSGPGGGGQGSVGNEWVEALFRIGGGEAANWIDALNLHDYSNRLETALARVDWLQQVAGRPLPVWITEIAVPSDPEARPGWSRSKQADEMVRFSLGLLASGKVGKLFWYTLEDGPRRPQNPQWRAFGTGGLFSCEEAAGGTPAGDGGMRGPRRRPGGGEAAGPPRGGRPGSVARGASGGAGGAPPPMDPEAVCLERKPKPAAGAYARLTELLSGAERVAPLPSGEGYRVSRRGAPDVVVAWTSGGEERRELRPLTGVEAATVVRVGDDPEATRTRSERARGEVALTPRPTFLVLD